MKWLVIESANCCCLKGKSHADVDHTRLVSAPSPHLLSFLVAANIFHEIAVDMKNVARTSNVLEMRCPGDTGRDCSIQSVIPMQLEQYQHPVTRTPLTIRAKRIRNIRRIASSCQRRNVRTVHARRKRSKSYCSRDPFGCFKTLTSGMGSERGHHPKTHRASNGSTFDLQVCSIHMASMAYLGWLCGLPSTTSRSR